MEQTQQTVSKEAIEAVNEAERILDEQLQDAFAASAEEFLGKNWEQKVIMAHVVMDGGQITKEQAAVVVGAIKQAALTIVMARLVISQKEPVGCVAVGSDVAFDELTEGQQKALLTAYAQIDTQ